MQLYDIITLTTTKHKNCRVGSFFFYSTCSVKPRRLRCPPIQQFWSESSSGSFWIHIQCSVKWHHLRQRSDFAQKVLCNFFFFFSNMLPANKLLKCWKQAFNCETTFHFLLLSFIPAALCCEQKEDIIGIYIMKQSCAILLQIESLKRPLI